MMEIKPTLILTKGKWYVCVTVPIHLREYFNGQKQLKLSCGTADRSLAEKRFVDLATKLFDRLRTVERQNDPVVAAAQKVIDITCEMDGYAAEQLLDPDTFESTVLDIQRRAMHLESINWLGTGDPEEGILIRSTQKQMKTAIEEFEGALVSYRAKMPLGLASSNAKPRIKDTIDDWLSEMRVGREKTKSTYRKHAERFINFAGNLHLDAVTRVKAVEFTNYLATKGLAQNTIGTSVTALRGLFNYAMDQGLVSTNPFAGLKLRGKGKPSVRRDVFSRQQLIRLFEIPMKPRDRLCLQILAATGMRLDEAALLRFEDIRIDEDTGIRFFDLTDPDKVLKNDQASRRKLPIPDALSLPKQSSGRLFDYPTDRDGKAQNAASKALMRQIRKVQNHNNENLVVHSLRHTYKDMLRDSDIPKDMQDFLLGHASGSVGESYGHGYSLAKKKAAIDELDLSFLQGKYQH